MFTRGVSVIVPCLNEEESIGQVVDAAKAGIAKLDLPGEVIVVDNNCTDNSVRVAREHGATVIVEEEAGYGAAIRCGFAAAQYSVLVMGDGDLTYDFAKIDELVTPVLQGEADMVVGNRMNNIQPGAMPKLHQYLGNPLLSMLLRLMFWKHIVRDAHCGLRAIDTAAYHALGCVTTGMEFASELVVRSIQQDLRMQERDIIYHPRVGESKLSSFRDGWRHLRFMWLHSPTSAMLLPGVICWLLGIAIVLPLAFGPIMINGRAFDIHFMLMGGIMNVISMQFLTIGLLAKAYAHVSGLRRDPWIQAFYEHLTFEKFIFFSLPIFLLGSGILLWIVLRWAGGGFGELDMIRPMFLGLLFLANGAQVAASGYLFSIMALPKHVAAFHAAEEALPPANQK